MCIILMSVKSSFANCPSLSFENFDGVTQQVHIQNFCRPTISHGYIRRQVRQEFSRVSSAFPVNTAILSSPFYQVEIDSTLYFRSVNKWSSLFAGGRANCGCSLSTHFTFSFIHYEQPFSAISRSLISQRRVKMARVHSDIKRFPGITA